MQKIRDLMMKCGLSEEAADNVCQSITEHISSCRATLEEDYNTRAEAAKRICVEETEAHKLELGRRLQIFCEANHAKIESIVAKQSSQREGQATGTLETIKSLLEGITIADDTGVKAQLQQLQEQNQKLQQKLNEAVKQANNQTQLASRVLKRNRVLESKNANIEDEETTAPRRHTVLGESTEEEPAPRATRRIDQSRQRGTPTTTRRTIAENVDRREPVDDRNGNTTRQSSPMNSRVMTPAQIAESIEEDAR